VFKYYAIFEDSLAICNQILYNFLQFKYLVLTLELPHGSILTHMAVCVILSPSLVITVRNVMIFSRTWTYTIHNIKNCNYVVVLLLKIMVSRPTPYNYRMGKKIPLYKINVIFERNCVKYPMLFNSPILNRLLV